MTADDRTGSQESVAVRIRAARLSAGLSQREVADKCDTTQATVARWEGPDSPFDRTLLGLRRLATALGTTVSALIGDKP